MFCLHVCICSTHMPGALGHEILRNWSYVWLTALCMCWELNPGPLKEQQVLSADEIPLWFLCLALYYNSRAQTQERAHSLKKKKLNKVLPYCYFTNKVNWLSTVKDCFFIRFMHHGLLPSNSNFQQFVQIYHCTEKTKNRIEIYNKCLLLSHCFVSNILFMLPDLTIYEAFTEKPAPRNVD